VWFCHTRPLACCLASQGRSLAVENKLFKGRDGWWSWSSMDEILEYILFLGHFIIKCFPMPSTGASLEQSKIIVSLWKLIFRQFAAVCHHEARAPNLRAGSSGDPVDWLAFLKGGRELSWLGVLIEGAGYLYLTGGRFWRFWRVNCDTGQTQNKQELQQGRIAKAENHPTECI
jgi:hypothetical protein